MLSSSFMRIIWSISFLLFSALSVALANAAPGDAYEASAPDNSVLLEPLLQRQSGPSEGLKPLPGFDARVFAFGLGNIGDIVTAKDGTLYSSDAQTGRVFEIADRGLDGRRDFQRPVLSGLSNPSGLAITGDTLFVADRHAIWAMDRKSKARQRVASLENMAAAPLRPLIYHEPSDDVWIALTLSSNSGQVIAVDPQTGGARLIADIPGPISAMDRSDNGTVWVGSGRSLFSLSEGAGAQPAGQVEQGVQISGFVLVGGAEIGQGFSAWRDHVILSQSGGARQPRSHSGAMNLVAVASEFGKLSDKLTVWADGFLDHNRRNAWGDPGAIALDRRGLFVADRWNGTIWRVYARAVTQTDDHPEMVADTKEEPLDDIKAEDEAAAQPSLVTGSRIEKASGIEVGSTILKAWEEEKAKKDADSESESDSNFEETD